MAVEMAKSHVLTAAASAANTGLAAHQLGHEANEIARIGQKMAMIAVIRKHRVIGVPQRPYHRHLAEFLTDAGMCGAGELAFGKQVEQERLGRADSLGIGVQGGRFGRNDRPAMRVAGDVRRAVGGRHRGR